MKAKPARKRDESLSMVCLTAAGVPLEPNQRPSQSVLASSAVALRGIKEGYAPAVNGLSPHSSQILENT